MFLCPVFQCLKKFLQKFIQSVRLLFTQHLNTDLTPIAPVALVHMSHLRCISITSDYVTTDCHWYVRKHTACQARKSLVPFVWAN